MTNKERTTLTLDAQTKADAGPILDQLGVSLSAYVEMSLRQLVRDKGMPFRPTIMPNAPHMLAADQIAREMNGLDAATPSDVQEGLAAIDPQDERRILEARDD